MTLRRVGGGGGGADERLKIEIQTLQME